MQNGSRYVVNSESQIYLLPNSSCDEGSTVTIGNQTVQRYILMQDKWVYKDDYTTGNYSNTNYICHIWNSDYDYSIPYGSLILPATLLVFGLFWFLYKMLWGARR